MAFAELPENPNLEHLKKQAKALLKAVRAGETIRHLAQEAGDPAILTALGGD